MDRIQYLRQLEQDDPEDSFVLFALAKEYEKVESPEKALDYYLKLYKKDPEYIGLYYHLGKLYEELEEYEKALKCYQEGVERSNQAGDQHSKSELMNAKTNLELTMEDS